MLSRKYLEGLSSKPPTNPPVYIGENSNTNFTVFCKNVLNTFFGNVRSGIGYFFYLKEEKCSSLLSRSGGRREFSV